MRAINPFFVLDVDEAASRAEIDTAYKRLIVEHHPDRFATASTGEQRRAVERAAEINEAYLLLTDPEYAARNRLKFDRVRAAGVPVEPAPQRRIDDADAATSAPGVAPADYRRTAASEFDVPAKHDATPWVAPVRRRRFGRR